MNSKTPGTYVTEIMILTHFKIKNFVISMSKLVLMNFSKEKKKWKAKLDMKKLPNDRWTVRKVLRQLL